MPLPTLARNARLTILVVGLVLIVWVEWTVVLSGNWRSYLFGPLGYALLVLMIGMVYWLGFDEECTHAADKIYSFAMLLRMILGIIFLIFIFVGFPLLLFFSFFTDRPHIPLILSVILAAGYFLWKRFRLRLRQN